jgi:hypothetical protein
MSSFHPLDPWVSGSWIASRSSSSYPGSLPFPCSGRKLRWDRVGGEVSDRQWRDIVGVLRHTGAALDDAYLEAVAKGARLEELLARARADAVT